MTTPGATVLDVVLPVLVGAVVVFVVVVDVPRSAVSGASGVSVGSIFDSGVVPGPGSDAVPEPAVAAGPGD